MNTPTALARLEYPRQTIGENIFLGLYEIATENNDTDLTKHNL